MSTSGRETGADLGSNEQQEQQGQGWVFMVAEQAKKNVEDQQTSRTEPEQGSLGHVWVHAATVASFPLRPFPASKASPRASWLVR